MVEYFVDFKLHNSDNDGWAFKTELHTSDKDAAVKKFHSVCAQYIGTNPFDHVLVILSDAFGNVLQKEIWDAPTPEPQPEPTPESEPEEVAAE